jgi:hypothetical protein
VAREQPIKPAYSDNRAKPMNGPALCGQNAQFLNVKAVGIPALVSTFKGLAL